MHRYTRATAIPPNTKKAVALRDCANGPATCIICGQPGMPCCHIVRRSQGGMGIAANIVTLCSPCHYALDEGLGMKRLRPLGLNTQQDVRKFVVEYIKCFYPDWTEENVKYKKGGNIDAESDCIARQADENP